MWLLLQANAADQVGSVAFAVFPADLQLRPARRPEAATPTGRRSSLYGLLERLTDNPVVTLNRAVAVAMVHGPEHGLALVEGIATDPRVTRTHRVESVRAHLHEHAGRPEQAARHYREAARRATSTPEQRYLHAQAVRLGPD
jgi:predicted RNA polymerase sigma factor